MESGSASSVSAGPQSNVDFLGLGDPGSVITKTVTPRAGNLESDMQWPFLYACDHFTGKAARYLRTALRWFHPCAYKDVKMSELREMIEEMSALNALLTDAMEYMNTNLTDVDTMDAHNQADLACAPIEPVHHLAQTRISHRSQEQSS